MSDAVSQHLLVISSEKKDEIANLQLLLSEGSAALDPMGTPRPSVSWRAVGAIEDEERRIARIPGSDAVLTGMPPMPIVAASPHIYVFKGLIIFTSLGEQVRTDRASAQDAKDVERLEFSYGKV
ncbi:MAG: hypothetical protein LQ346_008291 [Caloplaca aetnensis]|nr:MAG: hypothetical protein LQ346_008291 [Caloplaca aetnensis]